MDPICMVVADLELEPVACAPPDASLAQAARALAETRHGVLVIETTPLGEMTDAGLVDALAGGRPAVTHLVDVPRAAPQFVRPDTAAEDAAAIMIVTGRRALVVVDEGQPLGVITLRTVIGALWGGKSWLGAFRVALHVTEA